MKYNKALPPETIDEQVEQSLTTPTHASVEPESKMIQHLSALYKADKLSTERVGQRLAQRLAEHNVVAQSAPRLLKAIPEAREAAIQSLAPSARHRGSSRFALLAAVLCVSLLVGSLLAVFHLAHNNQSAQIGGAPTSPSGIYFIRSGDLYRLDVQTRKVIWQTPIAGQPGPQLTQNAQNPVVIGDATYVVVSNTLIAFSAQTGARRWSHEFTGIGVMPFADNNQLYVKIFALTTPSIAKNQLPGASLVTLGDAPIYAVNSTNGTIMATYRPSQKETYWSDPTIIDSVLYYQSGDNLYASQLPGKKLLWQVSLDPHSTVTDILAQNGVVYAEIWQYINPPYSSFVEALTATNGHKLWQLPTNTGSINALAVTNSTIYEGTFNDGLQAFSLANQTLLWQKPYYYTINAIHVLSDSLYLSFSSPLSAVNPVSFLALDAKTGQLLWQKDAGNDSRVIKIAGGIFYGLSWTYSGQGQTLYALDASKGTPIWTMPIDLEGDTVQIVE